MKTRIAISVFALSLLIVAGCSKNESDTATPTPTATATLTPSATATAIATASPVLSASPLPTASPFADVNVRLRDMEGKMNAIFADTFRSLSSWFGQSTRASSVDLREENDKYIARLYVPKGDNSKVDAKVENGSLEITAQNEGTVNGKTETERYEQLITLPKPVDAGKVKVEKNNDLVVVTVPKSITSVPAVAAATPAATPIASPASSPADWADTMLWQMNQMQARLDKSIHDIFQNDVTTGASTSQLGSAMNLEDQSDKYVVHFYLPDRDVSGATVKLENGQLHLTAQEQKNTTDNTAAGNVQSTAVAHYESEITLPGPVKESEMKVDRKKGSVVVTLPKA